MVQMRVPAVSALCQHRAGRTAALRTIHYAADAGTSDGTVTVFITVSPTVSFSRGSSESSTGGSEFNIGGSGGSNTWDSSINSWC
ncbi:hypothetical protein CJU89_6102 [Yarrowia sp. B02]|nr:hypothetical protein CJU89_6102 [Yarrowia sp. B02]